MSSGPGPVAKFFGSVFARPDPTLPDLPPLAALQPVGTPLKPDQLIGSTQEFVGRLADIVGEVTPLQIDLTDIEPPPLPSFLDTPRPSLDTVTLNLPDLPKGFKDQLDTDNLLPEPFDQNPPQLSFPTAPTPNFGDVPETPGINLPDVDPQLNLDLPDPPNLLNVNVSKFNGFQLPSIDPGVPEFTVAAPSIREYEPGQAYSSALLGELESKLQDSITNGGTGLNPDVEGAIWDRAREREYKQANDAILDLERMETMGFHMPPGVYMDGRIKVQTELSKNNAGHSREVMIKQAELELENVQRALQTAQVVEAKHIDANNQVEQRSFEAARFATEAGISLYNAKVQAYQAIVEAYRSKISIYEAQVRAELGKVEAYKAEVDAEQTKAQINQSRVDQFRTLTDAALSAVEVYKAEIAGIQAKADIEKTKIEIFGEQVRAHGNEVNAFTAQVEGFRASVGAETAKQDAFQSAAAAYGTQVDASAKAIDARISEHTAKLRAKEIEWQGYTAQVQAETERVKAIATKNDAAANVYQAEAGANAAFNDVLAKQWESQTQLAINSANVALEEAKANAEVFTTKRALTTDAVKAAATVTAQLGAAAISANNFSTSFSTSRSQSSSNSASIIETKKL